MSADYNAKLADEVAAEWVAVQPLAQCLCMSCGDWFLVARPGKAPGLKCPKCGTVASEESCTGLRKAIAVLATQQAGEAVKDEPAPVNDGRGDPPGLDDVIGNGAAVMQIATALDAYRSRLKAAKEGNGPKPTFPHLLLSGPGGTGKTMLAEIVAREIKRPLRLCAGQSLNSPARVADMLQGLKAGDVLFVDECHGLKPPCQETLYRAMEDGILLPVGRSGQAVGAPIRLPPFTIIGATTDEWSLLPSLLQRFKYRIRLERMTAADLAAAIAKRAEGRGWTLSPEAAMMIGERAHGTPRLAVGLLDGCMDVAVARDSKSIDTETVKLTCEIWGIDRLGLDTVARKYLGFLKDAGGEPVRLNVLATKLDGLSRRTVEIRIEPDLVFLGLVDKRPEGRVLTDLGKRHLT